MTRTLRRLALVGLAAALLAGCGDSPSSAPGAAAVVGDQRITTDELGDVVERGLSDPQAEQQFGSDRADFQRQVLNRLVRAALLEEAAEAEGVEVTRGDVDQLLAEFAEQSGGREQLEAQAAAGGIDKEDLPRFAREVALQQALADALTEDEQVSDEELQSIYDQTLGQWQKVDSRHILVADEAQARDLLAQVQADPNRFEALAAQFSTDTSNKDDGGNLGSQGRGTFVPEFDEAVFTSPVGEPFVVQTQFGWHVVEVLDRQVTELADAREELRRAALEQQREEAVQEALRETAERVGVEVNPRFGTWDAEAVEVQPPVDQDGLSSPEPTGTPNGQPGQQGQPGAPVEQGQQPPAPAPSS